MKRIFSNGLLPADLVANQFIRLLRKKGAVRIATPSITEATGLLAAAKNGANVELLVGLNANTCPKALQLIHGHPKISIRYFTSRFNVNFCIVDTSALLGSATLSQGGLLNNREATLRLEEPRDLLAIEELRRLFDELWVDAGVLTSEILAKFAQVNGDPNRNAILEARIESQLGALVPRTFVGASLPVPKPAPDAYPKQLWQVDLQQIQAAFAEVQAILDEHGMWRPELQHLHSSIHASRFLHWVLRTYARGGDKWESAPFRNSQERRQLILRYGAEWPTLRQLYGAQGLLRKTARSPGLCFHRDHSEGRQGNQQGLMAIYAFGDRQRFIGGEGHRSWSSFGPRTKTTLARFAEASGFCCTLTNHFWNAWKTFCIARIGRLPNSASLAVWSCSAT